jgi:hypothetical protein
MNRPPSIHHLARALPEEERRELYKRITRSLSLGSDGERQVYHAEMDPEKRRELVQADIERLGFFSRLRLWLRRLFAGGTEEEAFVEMRLADLRHHLKNSSLEIEDPEQSRVDANVAASVEEFHHDIQSAISLVRKMWSSQDHIRDIVSLLVADAVPGSKYSLDDFVSRRELENIFQNTESKDELRKTTLSALNQYVKEIHDSVFDHAKSHVLVLYYLRDIAHFDFAAFFEAFNRKETGAGTGDVPGGNGHHGDNGATDGENGSGGEDAEQEEEDRFRDAEMSAAIELLEQLYCAIHLAAQSAPVGIELVRAHLRLASPDDWEESQAKEQAERIRRMQERVRSYREETPLVDLIKFHRGNPYHRLLLYTPKLRLRQFYDSSIKIRVLGELDEAFPEIRTSVIGKLVHTIFGPEPGELRNYRGVAGGNIKKFGLPSFRYVRSVNIAYRMVTRVYQDRYQNLLRLLLRIMPPGRREISEELHSHVTEIEELQTRIEEFDATLAPDADDGKLFHKLRHAMESDRTQQRAYRVMVTQKDREARQMVVETRDHFHGMRERFEELLSSAAEQLRERYKAFDQNAANRSSLDAVLKERVVELRNFTMLMNQILAVEEGG